MKIARISVFIFFFRLFEYQILFLQNQIELLLGIIRENCILYSYGYSHTNAFRFSFELFRKEEKEKCANRSKTLGNWVKTIITNRLEVATMTNMT
jgi:hypothetical protein